MSQQDDDQMQRELSPPATSEELEEARALRDALEGKGEHPDVDLCESLRAAWAPRDLTPERHQELVQRAILRRGPRSGRVLYVAFGATSALALAAAVALLVTYQSADGPSAGVEAAASISLARSRTTQPLFDEPFARHGGSSQRMDRIVDSRARDYRANLFARMGVR